MNKESVKSYAMLISSMLIFGTIGIFRRYIPLTSEFLAFARGLIGGLCLCLFLKLRGKKIFHGIGWWKTILLMISGAIMGINWILLFEAYNCTTVATATLCYYMEPTIVVLLSPIIFKEKLTKKKMICVLAAIFGMVFISGILQGNSLNVTDFRGVFLGLGAACFYAGVVIMNKLIPVDDAYEKTIIQLLSAALVMVPYLFHAREIQTGPMDLKACAMLLVVCFIHTGLAYALYFGSIKGLKAQSIAVLSYIDPVFALFLSAAFLHEALSIFGIIGAILIIGSALVSELME